MSVSINRQEISVNIQKMIEKSKTVEKLKITALPVPKKPDFLDQTINIFDDWENLKNSYGSISNIPFNVLGDYLDKWNSLICYTRYIEAVADIKQTTALEIRDTVERQLYTLQDGGREIRSASVATEPLYIEWQNKYIEEHSFFTVVKGLRESYEFRASAISREITRRQSEIKEF